MLEFFLLAAFIVGFLYIVFKFYRNRNLSPSWRATSDGLCEVCADREAILKNEKSGLEVCEFCDSLLP